MRTQRGRLGAAGRWRWACVGIIVLAITAGCDALTLGQSRTLGATFPGGADGAGLIVSVEDRTGRVVGLDVAGQLPGGQPMDALVVLMRDPVEPDAFVVGWLGGACDTETIITLSPTDVGGWTVTLRTEGAPGACEDLGVERAATITMDGPVDLSRITLDVDGDG